MIALLEALGLFDWKWPPFAADLRLEMYQDKSGKHWVRAVYLGEVSAAVMFSLFVVVVVVLFLPLKTPPKSGLFSTRKKEGERGREKKRMPESVDIVWHSASTTRLNRLNG